MWAQSSVAGSSGLVFLWLVSPSPQTVCRVNVLCGSWMPCELCPYAYDVQYLMSRINTGCYVLVCCLQGEQHGFRKAETQRSMLEGELWFYSQVLGFPGEYSPELQPMVIDNLPAKPTA